jgi:superfamily I DNA and/or RNA helicase
VDLQTIRERVKVLQEEIAKLREANKVYLKKHPHSPIEVSAQRTREIRLQQILDELAGLTKTKIL